MEKKKKIIAVTLITVFIILLCAGAVLILKFLNKEEIKTVPAVEVSEIVVKEPETQPPPPETVLPDDWDSMFNYVSSPEGITQKTKDLFHKNDDISGWLKVDGTAVDYPVVSEPRNLQEIQGDEYVPNDYYLHRGLDKQYLFQGTLYMDYRNVFGADENSQSENIVIYGHNMLNDSMFGSLRYYHRNLDFYAENPIIQFNSNYRDYQYVIFGLMITSGSFGDTDFHYWNMEELNNEDDFNYYVDTIKQNSLVDTGVDVKYGDKLLTLSTCYADVDNSRFIVVARRLREGETSMENIGRTEAYIEEHRQEPETTENQ